MVGWEIFGLALCWALTLSTTIILTDIGPLSAVSIGVCESYASLTITFYFLGATVSSLCSIVLFKYVGRYWGFTIGSLFQLIGCLCGIVGMLISAPVILYLGCFSIGFSQGIGQFYRFAALDADKVSGNQGINVTTVLSGGVFAAVCGPSLATYSRDLFPRDFVGSYMMIGILSLSNQLVLSFIPFENEVLSNEKESLLYKDEDIPRPWVSIFLDPLFLLACGTATLSNTTMVMVMSQFSLEMNRHNFHFAYISLVLEFHILAMYSPSFFSGYLLQYLSTSTLSILGNVLYIVSIGVLSIFDEYTGYLAGMVLIGISWNLAYSSSTLMLGKCYRTSETYLVQGINDTLLMIVSGSGTLISGAVFARFGWLSLMILVGALTLISFALLLTSWYHSNSLHAPPQQQDQTSRYGSTSP